MRSGHKNCQKLCSTVGSCPSTGRAPTSYRLVVLIVKHGKSLVTHIKVDVTNNIETLVAAHWFGGIPDLKFQ